MLYVVVDNAMNAKNAIAVFTTQDRAHRYLEYVGVIDGAVEPWPVNGDYQPAHSVFAAHAYDQASDIHRFIGLYADYGAARNVAGQGGDVREYVPNAR